MKTVSRDVVSKSSIDVKERRTTKMSFDPEGMEHIARLVTDLYADEGSACIREYAANAWDSHLLYQQITGKTSRPIEVTLPTIDNPNLTVQDWGVGMSSDDIDNIYSKYGASTKRTSNDFVGSFGLGCKSGLSMSPAFVLIAIKNGIRTVCNIHRGPGGMGEIEYLSEKPTDEPSGVTVKIPVSDGIADYTQKARAIFVTWPRGSVLVNGAEPELSISSDHDFIALGTAGYLSRRSVAAQTTVSRWSTPRNGAITVNMGGIGYAVSNEQVDIILRHVERKDFDPAIQGFVDRIKNAIRNELTLVVNVEMGAVELISSRESVKWSNMSTKAVVTKIREAITALPVALADDFKDCDTRLQVLSKDIQDFANTFRSVYLAVEWKNEKLPRDLTFYLARNENYLDESIETFAINYLSNGERVPARVNEDNTMFKFGFESPGRSFALNTDGTVKNDTGDKVWYFVEVEDADEVKRLLSTHANSFHEDLRATKELSYSSPVTIVAHTVDIFDNAWLKDLFDASPNMKSISLETVVERAKARRRINAAANRGPKGVHVRQELTYPVVMVDADGKFSNRHMKPAEVDELAEAEGMTVYLDNNVFVPFEATYHSQRKNLDNFRPFAPKNAIIVGMLKGRKFDALQARISSPVGDLETDIKKNVNKAIKSITLKEYINAGSPWHLSLRTHTDEFISHLKSDLMRNVIFGNESKEFEKVNLVLWAIHRHCKDFIAPENKNWDKKFVAKREEIMDTCILVFGASREYQTDRNKYDKALASYVNTISSTVEKIVK